ncbi:PAS domain S-box protein [Skermanella aerolata]|uniref:PAS domain S-box protein n=1 Tax=Skermanella aerolata TaxID=393310 RepID=UPI00069AC5FB|nr:PAS domain S-box protein [Skermanella aerolata]
MHHSATCSTAATLARLVPVLMTALCLLLACPGPSPAQNAGRTVMLVDETAVHALGPDLEVLADETGRLTIDQVATPEFSMNFTPSTQDEPGFGITRSAIWSRITLNSILSVEREWFLVYRQALVDRISVYVPRPDGGWTEMNSGMLSPNRYFIFPHRYPVFPLGLQPAEQPTIYIRIENRDTLRLPLVVQSVASLYASDRSEQLLFGMLFGILITVCVYLFFIWRVMREHSQIFLITMQLMITIYISSTSGFLSEYLWSGMPWMAGASVQTAILLVLISGLLFGRSFVPTDRLMPHHRELMRGLVAVLAILIPLGFIDRRMVNTMLPWCVIVIFAVALHSSVVAIRARIDGVVVFTAAFGALLAGGLALSLLTLNVIPGTSLAHNLFHAGAAVSSVIFAIGIAGQFKARQEEKERALRLSNERFALAAQGASAGLYDWDLVNDTAYYSRRMAELVGGTAAELSADTGNWMLRVHPADLERVRRAYRAFLKSRSITVSLEYRVLAADGRLRWVSTTGAAVRDPATSRVLRVAGSTADITERKRAEDGLRASESLKAAVIASSLDCIITSDPEGRIIEFNPAAEQTFGQSRDAVMGKVLVDLIVPRHLRGRHAEGLRKVFGNREHHLLGRRVEVEAMRADGSVFPVELAVNEVQAGGQSVFTAFVRDITERRQAEAALRTSRSDLAEKTRFLETVLDTVAQGVTVMDAGLRMRLVNNRFVAMYGYPAELGIPGTPLASLIRDGTGSERPDGREVAEALALVREPPDTRLEETRPDGRVIEVFRRQMEDGGMVATYSDITRLKQAEREAKASEARFRGILEAHPVPVVITWLDDGSLFYASPRSYEIFAFGDAGVDGIKGRDFWADEDKHAQARRLLMEDGSIDLMEVSLRRRDGSTFPAAISAQAIELDGRMAAITGIYDLTDKKRAEAEIARQREALAQSEKLAAMGSLLAGVAHELNNPLSVVVGQSVLMQDTAPDEKTAQRARKIQLAADRCARIVKTFLSLARRRPPERREVDLNETVMSAIELVTYALRIDEISLVLDLADGSPHLWADPDQLNQVVTNLVVNAQQALQSSPRPRRITIATRFGPDAGAVRLTVSDNGPGVPPDIRNRIFDPFFTTKQAGVGTGVGLSLVHNIVYGHGGTITLGETPGGGATFAMELPARAGMPQAAGSGHREVRGRTAALRLLIVDDDPEIALTLAEMLEPDGHAIDIAGNGAEALERLAGQSFDLIISDLRMPELDGPGLYRELAARYPDMLDRIFFVTGDTLGSGVRDFLEETGAPVVEKPFEPHDLREAMARIVSVP